MTDLVLDLFAGPGGWSEGLRRLGLESVGLELDFQACRTRVAAGHRAIQTDVTTYPTWVFRGKVRKAAMSPVCPSFSKSGKGLGLIDLPLVQQTIVDLSRGRDTRAINGAACLDERSILTAEPMRWLYDLQPETVMMEQVPAVLPLWQLYGSVLRSWGYSTACGVLDAARYGAPQHRKRAVFIASRVIDVALPEPTHGGPGQPGLVPMVAAVGWGYTQRPAPTVTGGGAYTGGAEPFGNGTRQAMRRAADRLGEWADRGVPHLRPTLAECAVLQGFPPDYPFQGNAGQTFMQVGNAVPPLLAAHVASAATGIPLNVPALAAA
jgi:DNA (cytosine-5)-methyltransferase 1